MRKEDETARQQWQEACESEAYGLEALEDLASCIADEEVRGFLADNNAPGLQEMSARFLEALERGLWTPRSNSVYHELMAITGRQQAEIAGAAE